MSSGNNSFRVLDWTEFKKGHKHSGNLLLIRTLIPMREMIEMRSVIEAV